MTSRQMTCCVCGSDAGRRQQHWNRDTGFGICMKCIGWVRNRSVTEAEIADLYGKEGVNFGSKQPPLAAHHERVSGFHADPQLCGTEQEGGMMDGPLDTPSLEDHAFLQFMAAESYVSNSERAWLLWVKRVERCLGHSLDGNEEWDGYSLDFAYGCWEAGVTVPEYVEDVMIRKIALLNIGG